MGRYILAIVLGLVPSFVSAGIIKTVSITGAGTADFLTAVPNEFADFGGSGVFTLDGISYQYTQTSGDVGGLTNVVQGATVVADFTNSDPVTFQITEPGVSGEISFNYSGVVTLTPVTATTFTGEFVADFVPILGSGTGIFSDIVGGSFEMTALANEPFTPKLDPSQTVFTLNSPYTWQSTGGANDSLTAVPEPGATVSLLMLGMLFETRRKRRLGTRRSVPPAFQRTSRQSG